MCRLSWNLGASTSWNPQSLSRPVMGLQKNTGSSWMITFQLALSICSSILLSTGIVGTVFCNYEIFRSTCMEYFQIRMKLRIHRPCRVVAQRILKTGAYGSHWLPFKNGISSSTREGGVHLSLSNALLTVHVTQHRTAQVTDTNFTDGISDLSSHEKKKLKPHQKLHAGRHEKSKIEIEGVFINSGRLKYDNQRNQWTNYLLQIRVLTFRNRASHI